MSLSSHQNGMTVPRAKRTDVLMVATPVQVSFIDCSIFVPGTRSLEAFDQSERPDFQVDGGTLAGDISGNSTIAFTDRSTAISNLEFPT